MLRLKKRTNPLTFLQEVARTFAVDGGNHVGKFDVAPFQHLLQTVKFTRALGNQAFPVPGRFPQLTLFPLRNIAHVQQPMLQQVCNPLGILHIRLSVRNILHVSSIDDHDP